jgi:release factor glutamine methyltransferase
VIDLVAGTTVANARRALTRAFRDHDIDTPELDARVLTGHALALDHAGLIAASTRDLTAEETSQLAALATRRLAGEPVARIVGNKEFWSLKLSVPMSVLVPRPETEVVVEAALAAIAATGALSRSLRLADIGTGSGALLLALLSELPNATGIGTDCDLKALIVARDNAKRLGLAPRAFFLQCNYSDALAGGIDLLVANPPYVASGEIDRLAPEVRNHDPRLALDGGEDGLNSYRAIIADAGRLLAQGGHFCLELGVGQADAVTDLATAAGLFVKHPIRRDLAGIPRALTVQKLP